MADEAHKDQAPQTPEHKLEKVRDWLTKQGYPLEMRVARAFRNAGTPRVALGDVYRIESDKLRETDVTANFLRVARRGR
jgi:hypothetical protein